MRLSGALCQRIEQLDLANPAKIIRIMGDKDTPMFHRRAGNNSVAQRHPAPLPEPDSPLHHGIRNRQHLSCLEESLQKLPLLFTQTVVTEHLDGADYRDSRGMIGNKLPKRWRAQLARRK